MRWPIALIMFLHGIIHLMGAAKGFKLIDLPQLAMPISTLRAGFWLSAGIGIMVTSILYVTNLRNDVPVFSPPSMWWAFGFVSILLSQWVITMTWSDAKFGTIVNVFLLAVVLYGIASQGPWSFRSEYREEVQRRLDAVVEEQTISDEDLSHLPASVQRYVRQSGAVGQARVTHFRAKWKGRIRSSPTNPWMKFTAEQVNFVHQPARFFFMDAQKAIFPVDVFHLFHNASAQMKVRLMSIFPIMNHAGPELTQAETVTVLNDLSVLAPGALIDPSIRWESLGNLAARAVFSIGPNTISAVLSFNDREELVNFESDHRFAASEDGRGFELQKWSTPLSHYREFGPWRVAGNGEGWWHPVGKQDFAYIELELCELEVNPRFK